MNYLPLFALLLTLIPSAVMAATTAAKPAPKTAVEGRSTNLSFEDDNLEDLKRPNLDSLDTTRGHLNGARAILYMKRRDFREDVQAMLDESRYIP